MSGGKELLQDGLIGHCADVTEVGIVAGHLSENASHNLTRSRLGEGADRVNHLGRSEGANFVPG